jgi:uncharacterized protein YmfQ (DUF2313 family)
MNASGPDVAPIQCYTPNGCCGVSPCVITLDQFVCQIRSLLPEGDLYINTLPTVAPMQTAGSITVGCTKVGCDQLIFGGCCDDENICDIEPVAPQLAVVDSFSAVAYTAVQSLCQMLRELDPCTADLTIQKWAARFGITYPDPCGGMWSDKVLAMLICLMVQIRLHVMNMDYLQELAGMFGADITIGYAGDMNCGTLGWWTMAREMTECTRIEGCVDTLRFWDDPEQDCLPKQYCRTQGGAMRLEPPCIGLPESLNLIMSPSEIRLPPNCNNPPVPDALPHDEELYDAFKWLLPQILPQPVFWCVYEKDEANCIM